MDGLTRMGYGVEREHRWLAAAVLASVGLHLAGVLLFPRPMPRAAPAVRPPTDVIDIEPAPAPPAPPMEPPPPSPQPAPSSRRAPSRAEPKALAQAGRVVTRIAPADPLDFTGGFVTGTGTAYAGGTTSAGGTSRTVVRGPPDPSGPAVAGGGTGTGANLSRTASLVDDSSWQCPFPPEAFGVDEASVDLRVFVGADGKARDAAVIADPGHGFGTEALRCAIGKRWRPAFDRDGNPVPATAIVRVRFTRK
jgi:protein TonB